MKSLKSLAQAIALEALYQETTGVLERRLVTREMWMLSHNRTLKNWGIL